MKFKVVLTEEDLELAGNEWISFENRTELSSINSSYLFVRKWWHHFGCINNRVYGFDKKLSVVLVYDEKNEVKAIAPFCIVLRIMGKKFRYRSLEFIGQQWGANFLDIISCDFSESEIFLFWSWVRRNLDYDVLDLKYIPESTKVFDLNSKNCTLFTACPVLWNPEYEELQKTYSKKLKQNMRTALNRAAKESKLLSIKIFNKFEEQVFEKIIDISASKLMDNKHSHYVDPVRKNYLKSLYKEAHFNCILVQLDEVVIAYRINFIFNKCKYCVDASFDRNYKKFELGSLSVDGNIRDSCQKKMKAHYFGVGMDSYKLKFTKNFVGLYRYVEAGKSLKGKIKAVRIAKRSRWHSKQFLSEFINKIPV